MVGVSRLNVLVDYNRLVSKILWGFDILGVRDKDGYRAIFLMVSIRNGKECWARNICIYGPLGEHGHVACVGKSQDTLKILQ